MVFPTRKQDKKLSVCKSKCGKRPSWERHLKGKKCAKSIIFYSRKKLGLLHVIFRPQPLVSKFSGQTIDSPMQNFLTFLRRALFGNVNSNLCPTSIFCFVWAWFCSKWLPICHIFSPKQKTFLGDQFLCSLKQNEDIVWRSIYLKR